VISGSVNPSSFRSVSAKSREPNLSPMEDRPPISLSRLPTCPTVSGTWNPGSGTATRDIGTVVCHCLAPTSPTPTTFRRKNRNSGRNGRGRRNTAPPTVGFLRLRRGPPRKRRETKCASSRSPNAPRTRVDGNAKPETRNSWREHFPRDVQNVDRIAHVRTCRAKWQAVRSGCVEQSNPQPEMSKKITGKNGMSGKKGQKDPSPF
jgi:hypothetical protein